MAVKQFPLDQIDDNPYNPRKHYGQAIIKKIDRLDDQELARLVMELMFYYLVYRGDVARYEIKTELPLKWLGVDIQFEEKVEELKPAEVAGVQ